MDSKTFLCFCGESVIYNNENQLSSHIRQCQKYNKDSPVAQIFYKIPINTLEVCHLVAIKCEYNNYIQILTTELSKRGYASSTESKSNGNMEIENIGLSMLKKSSIKVREEETRFDITHLSKNMIKCEKCLKTYYDFDTEKIWYLSQCCHCICRACVTKYIYAEYSKSKGSLKCLLDKCSSLLTEEDYYILPKEKMEKLNQEMFEIQYCIVSCFKCKEKFEFVKGKPEQNMKDSTGKILKIELAIHYAENRFICPNNVCKTEQCKDCKVTPYHLGYDCKSFDINKKARKCRYCATQINNVDKNRVLALQEICNEKECEEKMSSACDKILNCTHPCCGYKKEIKCLSCLNDECAEKISAELLSQKGSDFCNICFVEDLSSAPCIQVKCGHIFHLHCMKKRLQIRWTRPRITFNFCLCPLCKIWMEFPADSELQIMMQKNLAKYEEIKNKSLERLKHEGRDKDERLLKPSDAYFNKPIEYAIAIYSYYECFKCKNPYFGGLKRCEDMMGEEQKNTDFKPEELVCANCCELLPIENCPKHGKDYIEFKCKFCCSVAQWFCWGNTHFCDPCHQKQCKGDYVTKIPKDKLDKCKGKGTCPVGGDHKANGDECALGCSLCRNMRENARNF